MPKRTAPPRPTNAELDILRTLWERGESTVREVYGSVSEIRDVGYTTVLKQMQVMYRKNLLTRVERCGSHMYTAAQPAAAVQGALVQQVLEQAFGGSVSLLLHSALEGRRLEPTEIDSMRALLQEVETGGAG